MLRQIPPTAEESTAIDKRFGIAQDSTPSQEQLNEQRGIRMLISDVAHELNTSVEDSPEKERALVALEEALMWAGKAVFK